MFSTPGGNRQTYLWFHFEGDPLKVQRTLRTRILSLPQHQMEVKGYYQTYNTTLVVKLYIYQYTFTF